LIGSTAGDHSILTRPLAAPDRAGVSGRITPRQNFPALNLPLVVTAVACREPSAWLSAGRLCVVSPPAPGPLIAGTDEQFPL